MILNYFLLLFSSKEHDQRTGGGWEDGGLGGGEGERGGGGRVEGERYRPVA